MKKSSILFSVIFTVSSIISQAQVSDPIVLMSVGGRPVTLTEFKTMYYNNLPKDSLKNQKSLDNYLKLFIDFRLKVNAAIDARIDTTASFRQEMSEYRGKLAEPKMRDTVVENRLIKEAYERTKWDVKASHVLIKVSPDASPEDTAAAYKKISDIRADIMSKKITFEDAAKKYSDDTYSKDKGGDLGYFTSMGMVYPFESAAYNAKVGEVTKPVRSQFGYHIIKVIDKKADVGQIEVAHIMIRKTPKMTLADSMKLSAKADSIYQLAKSGQDFNELVKKYSQDQGSARHGGILPWFGIGRMAKFPTFEAASFSLKNVGDITPPIMTDFGWHIIKLEGKKPVQPFDSVKDQIVSRVGKDGRSEMSVDALVSAIKTKYHYKENAEGKKGMYAFIDSSFYKGKWSADKVKGHTATVFSVDGKQFDQEDFAKFIAKNQMKGDNKGGQYAVESLYPKYVKQALLQYKNDNLEREDPKFADMIAQYRDGILLFDVTDKMVWTKALKDTTGLKSFYETEKSKNNWGERVDAVVLTFADKDIASDYRKMMKSGRTEKAIADSLNRRKAGSVTYNAAKFSKGDNSNVDASWKKGVSDDMKDKDGKIVIVDVKEILPPQPKSLDEVRGVVTTDYQNYLMDQWLKDLRAKYPVTVDQKVLGMVMPK